MSICQRKDGRYLVKYKDGGRWLQKTFRSLQDAEAFEGKVSYDEPENKRLTVSEAVVLFLSRTKRGQRTQEAYARVLERIGDEITTKYVDMLDRRDLENVRILLRDEWHLTNDGINRSVGYLKAAFRWCAAEDFIEEAPGPNYREVPSPRPARSRSLPCLAGGSLKPGRAMRRLRRMSPSAWTPTAGHGAG